VLGVILALSATLAGAEDELTRAERMLAAGDYSGVIAVLERVQDRRDARWHWLASRAYDGLNDAARAVEHAEAALAINPASEPLHLHLGQIFLARNTPLAAYEIFDEALRLWPGSLLLLLGRGLALKELQRYQDAERDLLACLERQPDLSIAFDALGTVYLHTKRFQELQDRAAEYRKRNPRDYRAYYYLAAAMQGLQADAGVIRKLLLEAIRLNPQFAASHALLGKMLLDAGEYSEAVTPLQTAIRLRPDYSPAYLHLATALKRAGREQEANQMFDAFRAVKEKEREPAPALIYRRGAPARDQK
jgi:tetratricopeptide (TPR) repeat protein